MFDDKTLGSKILGNPAATQYLVMQEIENRTNGNVSIADPNNGFSLLLEFSSSLVAQLVRQEDKHYAALYPKRAQTPEDLYPFLSDYSWVNLMAAPADVKFNVLFNKEWLIQNAIPYDDVYDIHVIPKETIATIANVPFTLYYPIMIKVNRQTKIITVQYDIDTPDPLKPMSNNLPYLVAERTINNVTYLAIAFDMYQFTRQEYIETVDIETGFNVIYPYSDKFYAVKVEYYSTAQDKWVSLDVSMSQQNYDVNKATALLIFDNDNQRARVRIPQVYFTKGIVGTQIRTTIYATRGAINLTISKQDMEAITIDFMPNMTPWSGALARMLDGQITTYDATHIEGGADPVSFQEFRDGVVNQTIYDQVPITNLQISREVGRYGFTLTKHLDNLADNRIFYAGATLGSDKDNSLVPVVASKIIFKEPYDCSTIVTQADGTLTILPTTLFKYDRAGDSSRPLRDDEVYALNQLTADELVATLNSGVYTRQPYHLWLDRSAQYPQAKSYNLMQPKMTSLILQRENIHSTVMTNIVNVAIDHLNDGTGGYKLYIYVERSSTLTKDNISHCKIILQTQSRSGLTLTFEASYASTDTTNGYDIYTLDLNTTYRLYADGYIQISSYEYDGSPIITDVSLTSAWVIKGLVDRSVTVGAKDDDQLIADVPNDYRANYLVVSKQIVTLQFGVALDSLIFNQVTTTWGDIIYQRYDTDIPYTYERDIYLTDRRGNLVTTTRTDSNGTKSLHFVKLFNKGDAILSGQETSYTLVKDAQSGDKTLSVNTSEGILVGQRVSGRNIHDGTTVDRVGNNEITLSRGIMNSLDVGSKLICASTYFDTALTTESNAGSTTLTIGNTDNIVPGMTIKGIACADGTTVTSISNGTLTLSQPLIGDTHTGDTYAIYYPDGAKSYKHRKGDIILDGLGKPIPTGGRTNIYSVMVIQFDARLYESEDPNDISFVKGLPSLLSDKSHTLDPVRDRLMEQTSLFYLPFRTVGDAVYGIGDNRQITMPLEMNYAIVYYVSDATKNDTVVQATITERTLAYINDYVQRGKISTNELGYELRKLFDSLVTAVDISGIDGTDTKTVKIDTQGASPSIEKKLVINAAGQKVLKPNITINFQVSPN